MKRMLFVAVAIMGGGARERSGEGSRPGAVRAEAKVGLRGDRDDRPGASESRFVVDPILMPGSDRAVAKAMAERMSGADPAPAERRGHFAWVEKMDGVTRTGWHGRVEGAVVGEDGKVVVTAVVFASLRDREGLVVAGDCFREMYEVANGRFVLVKGSPGGGAMRMVSNP